MPCPPAAAGLHGKCISEGRDWLNVGSPSSHNQEPKKPQLANHACPRPPGPLLPAVLANEEVIDGLSERGSHPVVRMPMKQWMLKITAYGDR